jgi:hypothetical protein
VAYISLDINPSVELGVNAFNKVVSAAGYNEDGKTILKGQNILYSDIKEAISKLVISASGKGFVADNGSTIISVTSETDNASAAANLEKAAEQGANDALTETGDTAVIYKDNVALSRRDEAKKLGITPGKLNLINKLQAVDPSATVDQYKDAKVTDIMKKVVELKKTEKTADTAGLTETSGSDIKNIEKAVHQSEKNAETNTDNSTVAAPADENTNTDENNGINNQKETESKEESESSAAVNPNAENGRSNSQKDKKDTSAVTTSPGTGAITEETVRHPGNNADKDNGDSTVTASENENVKKIHDNSNSENGNQTNNDNN